MSRNRVLIFDPNSTIMSKTDRSVLFAKAFFMSCECYVEDVNSTDHPFGSAVYSQQWDLIVVPYVKALAANYLTLEAVLARFADITIPVFVMQCYQPNLQSSVTNVSTVSGTAANIVTTGLTSWHSRTSERCTFYGDFPTAMTGSGYTVHATDGAKICMWSNTVAGHAVLWIGAQNSSTAPTSVNKPYKPWFGAQWMCDKRTGTASTLNKRYVQFWYDGYDAAADLTAFSGGHLDLIYNSAVAHGVTEMWLAATWSGAPGSVNPTVAAWLLARREQLGGLLRCCQHLSDLVDGTTGGAGSICSSNGVLFNQFATALTTYTTAANQLTAVGWKLGSNGLGAGYPNVQNGNSCNNPTAWFLSSQLGVNGIRLLSTTLYPDQPTATVETVRTKRNYSQNWNGIQTIPCWSADTWDAISNTAFAGQTANNALLGAATYGGAIYMHGGGAVLVSPWCNELFQYFSTCPDVLTTGPWETMVLDLKKGIGMNVAE